MAVCEGCLDLVEDAPPTNYDRIRSMSVEEMAECLYRDGCPRGPDVCKRTESGAQDCKGCWIDWLNSPTEGGRG